MSNVVIYDGVCALCDMLVRSLILADRDRVLKFAPLHGSAAKFVRERHPELAEMDSMFLVEDFATPMEKVYTESDAVLRAFEKVGRVGRVAAWLRPFLPFVRNKIYRWIARNRYSWFGRYETPKTPPADLAGRFLP